MRINSTLENINHEIDLIYMVDFKVDSVPFSINKLRNVPKLKLLLSSNSNAINYSVNSRRKWGARDNQIPLHFGKEFFRWDYDTTHKVKGTPYSELLSYNYYHKASFEVDCIDNHSLNGRFYIFFKNDDVINCSNELSRLKQQLSDLHHVLYNENRGFLNPFLDYGIVSPKDILLLSHLANGTNRNDIAEICSLTMRGIDYRITRMKDKFEAKNIAHLIRIAAENNLLTEAAGWHLT